MKQAMGALSTPAFLVDRGAVQRNCDRMRAKAESSDVAFRPHVKTHKTLEIGRMQHGGKPGPITVSTMAEAEAFADAGFGDLTYAMPIAPEKADRAASLASRVERLNVLVDSRVAFDALERVSTNRGVVFDVFLKVNCGYHRAGVDPDREESVWLALDLGASKATRFHGLLTHAGHSYDVVGLAAIRRIAMEERDALTRFRAKLEEAGVRGLVRSIGSTPTASVMERFEDCDEVRPGNYVFFDAYQAAVGSCALDDCAVSVLTTVVGSYPERGSLIVNAGALALSKDAGPRHVDPGCGYGVVCDLDLVPQPMQIVALSQEHGKIATEVPVRVGTKLRIVPNHSCLTAAMFEGYDVIEEGAVVDRWTPVRGW